MGGSRGPTFSTTKCSHWVGCLRRFFGLKIEHWATERVVSTVFQVEKGQVAIKEAIANEAIEE
ncbi:MAG: hypothetical protein MGG11_20705 [Trichodesmium sp. MAG_R03]|nr:hypothetical protein [Trichodesmium sp. MAG_R03]